MSTDAAPLIERSQHLSMLGDLFQRATENSGRLVVISGEAGVGKTTLLRRFVAQRKDTSSTYWGSCDALSTPRPLGPLQDFAGRLDSEISRLLDDGAAPTRIFLRLLAALGSHARLPVLVLEDVHWADTSTLDLIKFLGRRITSLRALVLLSMRSDEVARDHPIWRTLGEIPPTSMRRLELAPLSLEGVQQLTKGSQFDGEQLHRMTGGNPFFLSELISSGNDAQSIPVSIRDALRSRRAHIRKSANVALDVMSIFPSPPPDWLLARLLKKSSTKSLEECVAKGLLVRGDQGEVRFRHELARLAVLEDIPERTRRSLHAHALSELTAARDSGATVRSSNIIHHAAGAGDAHAMLRLAPLAAAEAARVGAHAQAAAHLSLALEHIDLATTEQAAELYEGWSYEAALAVKIDEKMIDARHRAITLWRSIGRQDKVGLNLRWLARLHWYRGEAREAEKYLSDALVVLEALPPGPDLAMAYAIRAQMLMLHRRRKEAIQWGNRAIELARRCDATETLVHALNTVGTAKLYAGQSVGMSMLEESLARSLQDGLHEQAARAYTNITSCAVAMRDFALAEAISAEGIRFDSEHDLDSWTHYLVGLRAQARLDQGHLAEARDIAESVHRLPHLTLLMRMPAAIVIATARMRLGDDSDSRRLEQLIADATAIGEPQYVLPAYLASIEAAWLEGNEELARRRLLDIAEFPLDRLNAWNLSDVLIWFHRCKMPPPKSGKSPALPVPRRLEMAGRHIEAGEALLEFGMHYEAAVTFAHATGSCVVEGLAKAMTAFESTDARAGVDFVRRRAASLGIQKQIPRFKRGPYAKARSHPLGLTEREVQILRHVQEGSSNREIAAALGRSERTVEHHMSAALAKLGVRNRVEALIRIQAEPWLVGIGGEQEAGQPPGNSRPKSR